MNPSAPRVVIVGAGFGGLRVARALRRTPFNVTLIDRRNYHLFQPLLYQVATSGLSPGEIAKPVRGILRGQRNLQFRLADVTGVDFPARQVLTSTGPAAYDYLILAIGGQTNYFGLSSVAEHGFGLKDLPEATAIRSHLLRQFELASQTADPDRRRAMLTFVVVGGGPTGVESAGAISELIRLVLIKDYPALNLNDMRILLLEANSQLLAGFPGPLQKHAAEVLWRKHIEVRFGARVTEFDGQRVLLKGGEVLPACTLIWAAGIRAEALADRLGVRQENQGRLAVQPTLQLFEHSNVFVVGDAAYLEADGHPLPMVAPVAMQQAVTAARNVVRLQAGQPLQPFAYRDPGSLATIGRNNAVARLGKLQFVGFFAWFSWLVVHIIQLIGFRNRLLVLINWAWDYFFYERAVRLIINERAERRLSSGAARVTPST